MTDGHHEFDEFLVLLLWVAACLGGGYAAGRVWKRAKFWRWVEPVYYPLAILGIALLFFSNDNARMLTDLRDELADTEQQTRTSKPQAHRKRRRDRGGGPGGGTGAAPSEPAGDRNQDRRHAEDGAGHGVRMDREFPGVPFLAVRAGLRARAEIRKGIAAQ